jgi:hypothetical protein
MIDFGLPLFVVGVWLLGFVMGLLVRSRGWHWWRRG